MTRKRISANPRRKTAIPSPSAQRPAFESGSSGCSSVFFAATA
jgi:hypothetical protein